MRQQPSSHTFEHIIRTLPRLYIKAISKPSVALFAEEAVKAEWYLVWIQILGWITLPGLSSLLIVLITSLVLAFTGSLNVILLASIFGLALLLALLIPTLLIASTSITYLIARAFRGRGTLVAQTYTSLLFQVPLSTIVAFLTLIPTVGIFLGAVASFAAFIYGMILQVYVMIAVHRIHVRTAVAVVFIPALLVLILTWSLLALLSTLLATPAFV